MPGQRVVAFDDLGVKVVKNVLVPMQDGVSLAADLYLPLAAELDGSRRFPLVMEYIPYRKDDVGRPEARSWYVRLPLAGYPLVRVDVRGTGASEGVVFDEYTEQEQLDGAAAVEWLAAQPWCDGHVNMIGISYGGFTSLQVASHAPPHLTSIVPIDFTDDRYRDDCHYKGGLMRKYYDPGTYGNFMIAWNAMPADPDAAGADWARVWEEHLDRNEPYILRWLRHQTDGPYWRNGSVGDVAERIRCPVFMIGGWRDGYTNPPFRLYEKLDVPRRLLVGPWNHAVPDVAIPGPRIDYLRDVVRWLDRWCKPGGAADDEEPPVVVYMQRYDRPDPDRLDTPGSWRGDTGWPIPGSSEQTLWLGAGGALGTASGEPGTDSLEYVATVGGCAGLWSAGVPFGLPGDQRPDEAFSLVYTSEPLEGDLHVVGRPRAVLRVSSTASVIGFVATLAEVGPDGSSQMVAKGALNATRRRSLTDPEPLRPGEVVELDVAIDATGWTFTRGNRIRLAIANADWPNIWPTPQPATSEVHRGEGASRLVLPVVPAAPSAAAPAFAPADTALSRHADRPDRPLWRVSEDILTGQKAVEARYGRRLDETYFACSADPRVPARASARGRHRVHQERPNRAIDAVSELVIEATETHFHVTIDLEVRVNEVPHFSRRWAESVPRELL